MKPLDWNMTNVLSSLNVAIRKSLIQESTNMFKCNISKGVHFCHKWHRSRLIVRMFSFIIIFSLVSCGGGGGSTGGNPNVPQNITVTGAVQKGPLIIGSTVIVQKLDNNTNPTGQTYQTQTTNDRGEFSIKAPIKDSYVDVVTTGYYYDEINGALSTGPLTLHAISIISGNSIKVNILTDLARLRIKNLVSNGNSFENAADQAQLEILKIFGITPSLLSGAGITDPSIGSDQMDITSSGAYNAILLAASVTCLQVAHQRSAGGANVPAELSSLLSLIASDIASDGVLNDTTAANDIRSAQQSINSALVRTNLDNRYASMGTTITVPPFEDFLDSNGNGTLNMLDLNIIFNPIKTNSLNTLFTTNSVTVVLPISTSATALVSAGTIVLDGIDTGLLSCQVQNGSLVAIRLASASTYTAMYTVTTSTLTIGSNSGSFVITTEYPQPILKNAYNAGILVESALLSADGTRLYIAGWSDSGFPQWSANGFQVLDVSDPSNPSLLGSYATSRGSARVLTSSPSGTLVYVGEEAGSLVLIGVTNPATPLMIGSFWIGFNSIKGVALSSDGNIAFVAAGDYGLKILNVSNPSTISLISSYDTTTGCTINGQPVFSSSCAAGDVVLSDDGNTAFVSSRWGGIKILNVTNKTAPVLVGQFADTQSIGAIGSLQLSTDNKTLFTTRSGEWGTNAINIINVANTTSPTLIGGYQNLFGGYSTIIVSPDESKLYVGGINVGMDEISIVDKAAPVLLAKYYDVVNQMAPQVYGLAINSNESVGYVAMHKAGLRIISLNGK